ncbi:MAG: hypothetical protein ABEH59_02845 [Halobacteriales archaeon]
MPIADLWTVELLVAAFAGGAFGAAIGALPSFSLAGLLVVLGETNAIARQGFGGPLPVDLTGAVAFGPVFGPHVAFGGGAAAAAYAARESSRNDPSERHPAKVITEGPGSRPDVLAVGGIFGMLGHGIATVSSGIGLPTDPVAFGVVGSALLHRVVFGYHIFGARPRVLLDGNRLAESAAGGVLSVGTDGGAVRDRAEPWLSYQYQWSHVASLGLVIGLLAGYLAYVTGSPFLAFGVTVVPLGLLSAGMERVPVTHHMALPASTIVVAAAPGAGLPAAGLSFSVALALGAVSGTVGGLLGEVAQRVFYAHAETHLDPPAASIVVTSVCIAALAWLGVLADAAWIPMP